jgi:hypothetical protein
VHHFPWIRVTAPPVAVGVSEDGAAGEPTWASRRVGEDVPLRAWPTERDLQAVLRPAVMALVSSLRRFVDEPRAQWEAVAAMSVDGRSNRAVRDPGGANARWVTFTQHHLAAVQDLGVPVRRVPTDG